MSEELCKKLSNMAIAEAFSREISLSKKFDFLASKHNVTPKLLEASKEVLLRLPKLPENQYVIEEVHLIQKADAAYFESSREIRILEDEFSFSIFLQAKSLEEAKLEFSASNPYSYSECEKQKENDYAFISEFCQLFFGHRGFYS